MGHKGVDTTELIMDGLGIPPHPGLGGSTGRGFCQMMDGVEIGRVDVAARACGAAPRAFEPGVSYARRRQTFGKPFAHHQAIQFQPAETATTVEAARVMMVNAARKKDSGERNDLAAGGRSASPPNTARRPRKTPSEFPVAAASPREYKIERLDREATMPLMGMGTAGIQKMIIGRRPLEAYRLQ